jgi:hypothetical protein
MAIFMRRLRQQLSWRRAPALSLSLVGRIQSQSFNRSQHPAHGNRQNGERETGRLILGRPSRRLSLPEDAVPQQMFILQAFRVRTMPILLSINPSFELLLPGPFGTVSDEK